MRFVKARFTSEFGSTAGLVLSVDKAKNLTVDEFSRMFPYSEAMKMRNIEISPEYSTWRGAFCHEFSEA